MRIAIAAIVSFGAMSIALLLLSLLASDPNSSMDLRAQAPGADGPDVSVDAHDAGPGPSPTPELREEELANFNAQEGPPADDDDGSPDRSKRSLDQECRDFPGASFCPPPPPTRLRISVSGDDDIRVSYVRSQWDTTRSSHRYRFELHQASSENGSYSSYKSVRDSYSPANFYNVAAGRWYKARGVRCENSDYTGCGDWSAFTDPIELADELPLPPAPSGFSARASSRTAVRLSWNSVSGTDGYEMDYRQGGSGAWRDVAGSTRNTYRTVTGLSCGTGYQFRVRANGDGRTYYDEWGAWSDTASASTHSCPSADPVISISGLASSLHKGQSDSFTVSASDLSSSRSYRIELEAEAGLAFDAGCTDTDFEYPVPSGRTSYSASPTVYACAAGSHDVNARLKRGSATEDSDSDSIRVTAPSISISGLASSLAKGQQDSFTVSASGMRSSQSYTVALEVDSGLAFDSGCSDDDLEYSVPRGRTSYSFRPTVYACSAGTHDVDAELKRGSTVEDTDSDWVRVAAAPNPEISISGLASSLKKGESDGFTVSASDLSSSSSYTIALEADSGLAFNAACTDDDLTYTVPSGRTSYSASPTVYACAAGSHDVSAELKRGSTTDASASGSVNVYQPAIAVKWLEQSLKKGESDIFTIAAAGMDPGSSYEISVRAEAGLAFDAQCSKRTYEKSVPSRRTAYETHTTIYACAAGSHDVNAELKRGTTIDASASGSVNVYQPSIAVKWLKQSLKKGESDIFTIAAAGMDPGSSYEISVRAEAGLAFDAACSKRTYEKSVPRRRTAYETHPTIYACSAGNHDVDAELKRGSNVDASASATVSVSVSADIPGSPVGLTARPGDGKLTVSWQPPADDGGSPISKYYIRYKRDGATTAQNPYVRVSTFLGPSVHSHALTGLTNAQGYTVQVWAINANGEGIANRAEITGATPIAPPSSTGGFWTANITSGESGGVYGYSNDQRNSFGSISNQGFEWMGHGYEVEFITWSVETENHATLSRIKIGLSGCLKTDEWESISIGPDTLGDDFDRAEHSDIECEKNRSIHQVFAFLVDTNPFSTIGSNLDIRVNLRPSRPSGLLANGYSPQGQSGRINVSWQLVDGADGYELSYRIECHPQITYNIIEVISAVPCGSETDFKYELVPSNLLQDNISGNDYFKYEILGVSRNNSSVYRIKVNAISQRKKSAPSYAIAYVSHQPPQQNPDMGYTVLEDGVEKTFIFASLATFPLNARWQSSATRNAPMYRYVICNPVATGTTLLDDDLILPAITINRANEIKMGILAWQDATRRVGFWKNGGEHMFIMEFQSGNAGCGHLKRDVDGRIVIAGNPALNEVYVLTDGQLDDICGADALACASTYPSAATKVTAVQTADIFMRQSLYAEAPRRGRCSQTWRTSVHEAGHALAFYGGLRGQYGHSSVSPSIMHARYTVTSRGICNPSFYDIGALAAVYQSR